MSADISFRCWRGPRSKNCRHGEEWRKVEHGDLFAAHPEVVSLNTGPLTRLLTWKPGAVELLRQPLTSTVSLPKIGDQLIELDQLHVWSLSRASE